MQDLFKEGTPAVTALIQLGKNFPVLPEQDSAGITGGEGVVSHHEDRGIQLLIDALDSGPVSYTHLDVYKRQILNSAEDLAKAQYSVHT